MIALSLSRPLNLPDSSERYFTDVDSENRYYEAVNSLADRTNYKRLYQMDTFGPRLNITRAEFSVFLSKTLAEWDNRNNRTDTAKLIFLS